MSQNEKLAAQIILGFCMALVTLTTFTFNACSSGFHPAPGAAAGSASLPSNASLPGTTVGSTSSVQSMVQSLAQLLELAISNFPGLSGNSTCETTSLCSGAGPSSRTVTDNCSGGGSSLTGTTLLTFNAAQCSELNSTQLNISPNLSISNSSESLQISSAQNTDYLGNVSGGGIFVTYSISSGSGSVSIPGLHFTGSGLLPLDISAASMSAAAASFDLIHLQATLSGGDLNLTDNLTHYSANISFSNLVFETSCACPLGGSASGSLSGAISGPMSITFNSTCGSITTTALGTTTTTMVPSCTPH